LQHLAAREMSFRVIGRKLHGSIGRADLIGQLSALSQSARDARASCFPNGAGA